MIRVQVPPRLMEQLELRDFQSSAINRVFTAWRAGHRAVVLCAPTGSGKRFLGLWFCQFAEENSRRVLFVCNRRLLVNQAVDDAERFQIPYGVIMADLMQGDAGSTNQIASVQTLESWYFYDRFGMRSGVGLPPADLIIVDECHGDLSRFRQLLSFYPGAKVLGLTATPVGSDGRSLIPRQYDYLVEGVKNSTLIQRKLLLPTTVYAPSEPHIEGVKIQNQEEYNQRALGRAVQECTVFADVFNEWAPFADRATVCFVPGIPFGRDLVSQFNRRLGGGSAHLIEAKTKPNEREEILDAIRQGDSRLIISCDVLREGFDLPVLSCGIDLQPNQQLRTYWQKLGRIKRAYEGQEDAVWLDFAGNYWRFPHPNEDPEWPEGDETTQQVIERRRKERGEAGPISCPGCSLAYKPKSRPPCCPGCGHVIQGAPTRRVRMGHGELVEVPLKAKEKRIRSGQEQALERWKGCLFAGMRGNWNFAKAAGYHRNKYGEWPKDGWPGTWERGSLDWKRPVGAVLTPRQIMEQFDQAKRNIQ